MLAFSKNFAYVLNGWLLISMFIRVKSFVLRQQKLQVLKSHQESCFVMEGSRNVGINRLGLWLKIFFCKVFLVGENIRVFEMKYFWNNVNTWHWEDLFRFYIGGFVDAHPLFRFFSRKTLPTTWKLYEEVFCITHRKFHCTVYNLTKVSINFHFYSYSEAATRGVL